MGFDQTDISLPQARAFCSFPHVTNLPTKKKEDTLKSLLTLLFVSVLAFPLSSPVFSQDAASPATSAKEARWEGHVIRSSSDKSRLTVRKVGSSDDKMVEYDSSTRWVSQEHGKKPTDIDATQVKDGDRVICTGSWDKNGVLHATLISKRLTGV
jgi:hypothetical protein